MISTDQINIRDPFILVHDGVYYLYGTRGATCWGPADGFDVYSSRDLASWTGPAVCFQNDGTFWADRNYWAPEVHPWQGYFWMFASFKSETRRRGTAILRSSSPLGPFEPWSKAPSHRRTGNAWTERSMFLPRGIPIWCSVTNGSSPETVQSAPCRLQRI